MKWNEIKKHFAQVDQTTNTSLEKNNELGNIADSSGDRNRIINKIIRFAFLFVVLVIIILGIIIIIGLFKKVNNKSVLPTEQLREVSTFLDENPPALLTGDEGKVINDVLNKPVNLNDADMQSINNFLNQ